MNGQAPLINFKATEVNVTNNSKRFLKEIANWSTFFAILGFIGTALMVLFGIGIIVVFSVSRETEIIALQDINMSNPFSSFIQSGMAFGSVVTVAFIYVLLGLFYFFPSFYLIKSAQKLKSGLVLNNSIELEKGFQNLKSVFKFWGIFTIIIMAVYALIFATAIFANILS